MGDFWRFYPGFGREFPFGSTTCCITTYIILAAGGDDSSGNKFNITTHQPGVLPGNPGGRINSTLRKTTVARGVSSLAHKSKVAHQ